MRNRASFVATTGNGIVRACSTTGDWSVERQLEELDVRCVAADPLHPGTVYAGTHMQGVLRSDDCGATWEVVGLPGLAVRSLAVSPTRPGVVYAGLKPPGLYVSHDAGVSWKELAGLRKMRQWWWFTPAEPGPEYVQAIALSPTDPDLILVGIEFGAVLRSADGGQTWTRHRRGALRDCHTMTFHPTNGDWVYEGGGGGAAFSRDGGNTWSAPRRGRDRHYGWAVGADPLHPEVWYMSASPGPWKAHGSKSAEAFIYRSAGGAAWEKLNGGLPQPLEHMPYALLTDVQAPGAIYAGLSNGDIWQSLDYGDTWHQLPLNMDGIRRTLIMRWG